MKIFSLTSAAIACLLLLCVDARASDDPHGWVEESFRHNGQGDVFANRHPLGSLVESAIGLALLPLRTWQQWQHRHHDGFEQFKKRDSAPVDWHHPFFEKQRALREHDDGESLR